MLQQKFALSEIFAISKFQQIKLQQIICCNSNFPHVAGVSFHLVVHRQCTELYSYLPVQYSTTGTGSKYGTRTLLLFVTRWSNFQFTGAHPTVSNPPPARTDDQPIYRVVLAGAYLDAIVNVQASDLYHSDNWTAKLVSCNQFDF